MLYTIFPAVVLGAVLMWLRLRHVARLSQHMWNAMNVCKAAVLTNLTAGDDQASVGSAVALIPTGELKKVHRFRDVLQVNRVADSCVWWVEGSNSCDSESKATHWHANPLADLLSGRQDWVVLPPCCQPQWQTLLWLWLHTVICSELAMVVSPN